MLAEPIRDVTRICEHRCHTRRVNIYENAHSNRRIVRIAFCVRAACLGKPHRCQGWRDSGQDARVDVGRTNVVFHGTGRLSRASSDFVLECWAAFPEHLCKSFPLRLGRHQNFSHPFLFLSPVGLEQQNVHACSFLVRVPFWRAAGSQIVVRRQIHIYRFLFHVWKQGNDETD